ncbi:MAG: ATP-binding protein [Dehalococcoidales bacterium]
MLAQRLVTILPALSSGEMLETTKIHSVSGLLSSGNYLVSRRPFRMPHHTVSYAGLVGGGSTLRQPLEGGEVVISRAASSLKYPAKFMLVAAMNPCKHSQ